MLKKNIGNAIGVIFVINIFLGLFLLATKSSTAVSTNTYFTVLCLFIACFIALPVLMTLQQLSLIMSSRDRISHRSVRYR